MATTLETPRLVLREMTLDDLDFVASMLGDPGVMRYYPKCLDRAESEAWVRRQLDRYAAHGYGFWLTLGRATGEPVGQVGLSPPTGVEGADETGVAYLIHRPYWRRGFAAEAAAACRDHAFDALGLPRLICLVRPENLPSQGVARKIGLETDGRRVEVSGLEHLVFSRARVGPARTP